MCVVGSFEARGWRRGIDFNRNESSVGLSSAIRVSSGNFGE